MAVAADPLFAAEKIRREVPDVILCDVEMPRMDGITFVQRIMSQHPMPVVICSSLAEAGSETALRALDAGAVEVIAKPRLGTRRFLEESKVAICDALRAASRAKLRPRHPRPLPVVEVKLTADAVLPPPTGRPLARTADRVVVIGASTGGTEALRVVIEALPADTPGSLVVLHMPAGFTAAFARRLDQTCAVEVREARHRDRIVPGLVLIAPGDRHLLLQRSGAQYVAEIREGPLVSRHRPSVDVLFRSAARAAGRDALGVIMTGMGDDGAKGLLELRRSGAMTVGQDEASCVVYGMPKEAAQLGAVALEVGLEAIPREIARFARR
jgi:two-component system chemotaxis response regulator CheB